MAVKPIPEGYGAVTPYLIVDDADALIEFLRNAFGAEKLFEMRRPDGRIWHGEIQIGDSRLMLSEASPEMPARTGLFYLYVEDVDAVYRQALAAGATSVMEPADQFYGDRHGGVRDASGNQWWIATHVEDVPPEEMERRQQGELERMKQETVPATAE
jgi:PhnB protein